MDTACEDIQMWMNYLLLCFNKELTHYCFSFNECRIADLEKTFGVILQKWIFLKATEFSCETGFNRNIEIEN